MVDHLKDKVKEEVVMCAHLKDKADKWYQNSTLGQGEKLYQRES
jgi:hypothetical protein